MAAVIAVCLIVIMLPTTFASEQTFGEKIADYCENLGDTDGNEKITVTDARNALRISVGLESASPEALKNADIDNDGKITVTDARNILRYVVGLSGFEIPASIASKNEIVAFFVSAANNVKQECPGFSGEAASVAPSIIVSVPVFGDMELSEFLKMVDAEEEIPQYYNTNIERFTVYPGNKNQHINTFTVMREEWSSKATGEDVLSANITYSKGGYSIVIKYGKSIKYTESKLPADMSDIPYGRMFNVGKKSDYINQDAGSDMDYKFNSLTFDNGLVTCNIDASDNSIKNVQYFNTAILDITMSTKDDVPLKITMVTTMNTTINYNINRLVPAQ